MERLVANLSGKIRYASYSGREFIVAPVTLLVPGVLNGSRGPLLYPLEEIARNADAWNGVPLVVNHPKGKDGSPVSARSPAVLNAQGIGHLFGAKVDGKLTAEGWFDTERTRQVDNRILESLEAGKPIELSTGLFTRNEPAEDGATYNGTSYRFVARDYRPDHLAILPDEVGACSVIDGCGVLVNAATKSEGGRPFPARDFAYVPDRNKPSTWKLRLTNVPGGSPDAKIVGAAVAALGKGFRGSKVQIPPSDLQAVKAKVRRAWLEANPGKSKDDLPRVLVVNIGGQAMPLSEDQRKEIVDGLITNASACCWEEEDREVLNSFSDEKLTAMGKHAEKEKQLERVANAAQKGWEDVDGNLHTYNSEKGEWETKLKKEPKERELKPVNNERKEAGSQTAEEWLEAAPGEVQSAVRNAMSIESREKSRIIDQLTGALASDAKETVINRLKGHSLEELQDLVLLAPESVESAGPTPSYVGSAGPTRNVGRALDQKDILPLPTINWEQKQEA